MWSNAAMQDNCAPSDTDWDRKVWFLPPSDFYLFYCIYIIYIYMCSCISPLLRFLLILLHLLHLHQHVRMCTFPSSGFYFFYFVYYIYFYGCTSPLLLDSSPPHMSQSPLREEAAVFAIQNMLCRVSCGKEMQDMEWKGALGILLTKPFPSNMYPPPSARNQSQTAQAQNILKLICLAKTSLKFGLRFKLKISLIKYSWFHFCTISM